MTVDPAGVPDETCCRCGEPAELEQPGGNCWPCTVDELEEQADALRAQVRALRDREARVREIRMECIPLMTQTNAAGRAYAHVVARLDEALDGAQ